MSPNEVRERRARIRQNALRAREALDDVRHQALNEALCSHLDLLLAELAPQCLAFCWPWRREPDLRAWMERWLQAAPGRLAALPVVQEKHAAMHFRQWLPGAPMAMDRYGIPYPDGSAEVRPDVVLVPLNAFDAAGFRLGYGGGYFDRTLAALDALAVGVGFELGRVDSVLPQAHDLPMDWIVTEAGAARALQPAAGEPRNMR